VPSKGREKTQGWLDKLPFIGGVVIVALIGVSFWVYARHLLRTEAGKQVGAVVVVGEGGRSFLVVTDKVAAGGRASGSIATGHRVTVLDAQTGAKEQLRIFDDALSCFGASPGRVWCSTGGTLKLLAVPALDELGSVDALVSKSGLGKVMPDKWRLDGAAVVVLLADGRGARVDPVTLQVAEASSNETFGQALPKRSCGLDGHFQLTKDDRIDFGEGTRKPLVRHAAKVTGQATYLSPQFMRAGEPDLCLVMHQPALDRPDDGRLTRVDAKLQELWQADVPAECETAQLVGQQLVMTFFGGSPRALALDPNTGKVLWSFSF
jgi:hypothetical protein